MSQEYGFTQSGFVRPTMADIRQDIIDTLEKVLKVKLRTSPSSVMGQIIDSLAERDATKWEVLEAGINNINPHTATDVMLDKAVSFTGVTRIPASYGTATVSLTYNAVAKSTIPARGFTIATQDNSSTWTNGSEVVLGKTRVGRAKITPKESAIKEGASLGSIIIGATSYKFPYDTTPSGSTKTTLSDAFVANNKAALESLGITITSSSGSIWVEFHSNNSGTCSVIDDKFSLVLTTKFDVTCTTTGTLTALAGTLTQVVSSSLSGDTFISVTNEEDAVPGHSRESHADLRIRYEQGAPYINGGCTNRAIEERVKQYCQNIEAIRVFSNKTDTTDSLGRPPHSLHVVVKGGESTQIGELLFDLIPGGIPTFGNTIVDIDRDNQIKIDRPTPVYIHIRVHVEGDPTNDEEMTKGVVISIPTAISQYGENTHTIGTNVVAGRIGSVIYNLQGVITANIKMARTLDDTPPPDDQFSVVDYINIADNEYAVFKSDNVIVQ